MYMYDIYTHIAPMFMYMHWFPVHASLSSSTRQPNPQYASDLFEVGIRPLDHKKL